MKDGDYTKAVEERFPDTCAAYQVAQVFVENGDLHIVGTYETPIDFDWQVDEFIGQLNVIGLAA